eukprot:1449507-Rhodomonas_salina.9
MAAVPTFAVALGGEHDKEVPEPAKGAHESRADTTHSTRTGPEAAHGCPFWAPHSAHARISTQLMDARAHAMFA